MYNLYKSCLLIYENDIIRSLSFRFLDDINGNANMFVTIKSDSTLSANEEGIAKAAIVQSVSESRKDPALSESTWWACDLRLGFHCQLTKPVHSSWESIFWRFNSSSEQPTLVYYSHAGQEPLWSSCDRCHHCPALESLDSWSSPSSHRNYGVWIHWWQLKR